MSRPAELRTERTGCTMSLPLTKHLAGTPQGQEPGNSILEKNQPEGQGDDLLCKCEDPCGKGCFMWCFMHPSSGKAETRQSMELIGQIIVGSVRDPVTKI